MWALRALVITLSIQAGTLDLVETPPGVSNLPVAVPNMNTLPLNLPAPRHLKGSTNKQGSPSKKHPAASKGGKCVPAARYFLSSGKLHDYLMNKLPPQIENIVKCDDLNMAGVLGILIPTLDNSDLLSQLDPTSLLLEVDEVTVDSTDITMAADEIHVHSTVTATIGGKGALGPVVSALQFESILEVTMKIAVSSNNTQCVNLDIQDTHIQVNEINIQLIETVTGTTMPLPVSLPLNDSIPRELSAEMNKNLEKSNSCAIVLKDFIDCKNASSLFKYQVQDTRISPKGLSILYCVEATLDKETVPVPGGWLPPDPKNATISITMSNSMLKILLTDVAKHVSVKMNDLEANITKITYAFQKDQNPRVTYEVAVTKDSEDYATWKTQLIMAYDCEISNTKLETNIKLIRSDHRVEPPEAKEELEAIMDQFLNLVTMALILSQPVRITVEESSRPLLNFDVNPLN